MIEEVDLNLKEEMIDADINHDQGAVHAPGDHTQRTDDHHAGGENLHLTPQADDQDQGPDQGQDPGPDPMVRAGILSIQAVTPLPRDSHPNTINDPTHQNASTRSIHVHMTPGKGIDWIESRTQFDKR